MVNLLMRAQTQLNTSHTQQAKMYKLKTAATTYPLTLSEVKLHLKVSVSTDDDLITALRNSAIEWVEQYTNRQIMPATWYLYKDTLVGDIELDWCPVTAVSSLKYYDTDNALQTLSTDYYDVDTASEPARICLAYGYDWPTVYERPNAVTIEFTAGYADAASVPAPITSALLLMIGHNYENRGDEGHRKYPKAIYDLLDMYRLF